MVPLFLLLPDVQTTPYAVMPKRIKDDSGSCRNVQSRIIANRSGRWIAYHDRKQ
jgi:hypothetical protein